MSLATLLKPRSFGNEIEADWIIGEGVLTLQKGRVLGLMPVIIQRCYEENEFFTNGADTKSYKESICLPLTKLYQLLNQLMIK